MNILEFILKIFSPIADSEPQISEKFTSFTVKFHIVNFSTFDINLLAELFSFIPANDSYILTIKIDENDPIDLTESNIHVLSEQISSERKIYEGEPVFLNFEITKETSSFINIYNFKSFEKFWTETSLTNLLKLIKLHQTILNRNDFIILEGDIQSFDSNNISFSKSKLNNLQRRECIISENCHFGNRQDYPFDAKYFHINNNQAIKSPIIDKLTSLSLLFSIISIFDITAINESELYYKLNGYKSFEDTIGLDKLDINLANIYFKISNWIYTENSNVCDKIGLTRNILSLSFQNNTLLIPDSVFLSIQSGYKAYLQENISKYIEIRNKIVDELGWISQKSGEIVSNFLNNYQKSIFTFLSFFISVFLLRFFKGSDSEIAIFSKEVTLFSYSFLLLSVIFLIFSLLNLKKEKERLSRKYQNVKNRYLDLLDENDIKRILKDDTEFNYELSYIENRIDNYTLLWILTLIILAITIFTVSDFYSWTDLIYWIKSFCC